MGLSDRCVFCNKDEEGYICGRCVQKIMALTIDQLRQAHAIAIQKGYHEQAEVLSQLIEEEEFYVPKTGKARSGMERKRLSNASRFARY